MGNKRRARVLLFAALALLAAVVPAGLAAGSHDGSPTSGEPSIVYLTLGSVDRITWTSASETISGRNNCSVTFGGSDLLDLSPTGGQLGFVRDGFGVKSTGDGTGEPCGRVEATDGEAISVSLGSNLGGYLMTAIDVDLELKFNATVDVIFKHEGVEVARVNGFTGMGGSDDGPDSGDLDNFRFFHRPMNGEESVSFDTVVFDPSAGAISLEGGADGTDRADDSLDESSNSSQFEIVQAFEGEITCNDTEEIGEDGVSTSGVVIMHSEDPDGPGSEPWITDNCDLKPFNEDVEDAALAFVPELAGTEARYTIEVTVEDQVVTVDGTGQVTSLVAVYNANGDLTFPATATDPLLACEGQPVLNQSDPGYDAFWTQADTGLLPGEPGTEIACWYHASVDPTGSGVGTERWGIYFEDDPGFNFR